jgi:hypothetical protein
MEDYVGLTREWSGMSGWNLNCSFARLRSTSSNGGAQNFSYRYAVQGCEKTVQICNVQLKFAPPRTRMTAARLAVALYSPVNSNGVHGPDADTAVKDLRNVARARTHARTHTHIYILSTYVNRGWGMTMTTHPHGVPRSRTNRSCNSSPPKRLHGV